MKTGVLTFHRVYNYGAVLQAYSMQMILDDMGIENEIIDFSPLRQRDSTSLYSTRNGIRRFGKTMLLLPFHRARKTRQIKFDHFISRMRRSAKIYSSVKELNETNSLYDRFLVGSDQVWNVKKKREASDGYFLNFVSDNKEMVSYASSTGNASYEELVSKQNYLCRFHYISCREKGGAGVLSRITGQDIPTVLDPTLLVNQERLLELAKTYRDEPYILYYSLDGYDKRKNNLDILSGLSDKFGLKIRFITPEWPGHCFGKDIIDAGPEEFLGLIKNANLVCTNSFHGTALSVRFNVPFYVLEARNVDDERKRNILQQLGLEKRILSTADEVEMIGDYRMEFGEANIKLERLREKSYAYLKRALGDMKGIDIK